jgi:aldose 1-epimerase
MRLSYFSADGEEGYPGNLTVRLNYRLDDDGKLSLNYEAETDRSTVINLTSHPFFNLNGQGEGSIESHLLQINASKYNPIDSTLIPTGIDPVENTPFDFRTERTIGARLHDRNEQLKFGGGYDHNFILDGEGMRSAAVARGDRSGITMEVTTDQPAIQLYSGNFMKSENTLKYGKLDTFRSAFCLETQHYPDSPNQPDFPSTVLEPGQTFRSASAYRFT